LSTALCGPPRDRHAHIIGLHRKLMQLVVWLPVGANPPMTEAERVSIALHALCAALVQTADEACVSRAYVEDALRDVWERAHAPGS
jgi:hypothetical protein